MPDKSVYEKASSNESDFIKERIKGLEHFFTLISSHPDLKESEELRIFLTESDSVYEHNYKAYIEEKNNQSGSTWFSYVTEKGKNFFQSAKEIDYSGLLQSM